MSHLTPSQARHFRRTQSRQRHRQDSSSHNFHCNNTTIYFLYKETELPCDPSQVQCTLETFLTRADSNKMRSPHPEYLRSGKIMCPSCVARVTAVRLNRVPEWKETTWFIWYNSTERKRDLFSPVEDVWISPIRWGMDHIPEALTEYRCFRCQFWKKQPIKKFDSGT